MGFAIHPRLRDSRAGLWEPYRDSDDALRPARAIACWLFPASFPCWRSRAAVAPFLLAKERQGSRAATGPFLQTPIGTSRANTRCWSESRAYRASRDTRDNAARVC